MLEVQEESEGVMGKSSMTIRKCIALVTYKNGKAQIEQLKLEDNLPFTQSEMRKWILAKEDVKSVVFLGNKK